MKNAFLCSFASPSVWREWIEMQPANVDFFEDPVSLRVEGVE